MKILQSITYYSPYVSGMTIYAQQLGEELVKRGYYVLVLTSRYNQELPLTEAKERLRIQRVPVLLSVSKGPIMPSWPVKVWRELKNTDTVLVHLPQFEGIITAVLAKFKGKALIVVYHCEVTLPQGFFNSQVRRVLDFAQWIVCKLADKIVVYTNDYTKYSRIASRFLDKTVQIYPPVVLPEKERPLKIKKRMGEVWVGFSGRVAAEKGIEYLLEAVQNIVVYLDEPDVQQARLLQLIIAGPKPVGEDKYVQKIKRLVKQVGQDVTFLGSLAQEELVSFYKQIDVLVLPSINSTEAFGLVQVEAMLCGTPVVATDLPGVRMPVQETGMGKIVPVKNSQALAIAIIKILQDRKKYIKPRHKIEKIFSFAKTIDSYERLFSNAAIEQPNN